MEILRVINPSPIPHNSDFICKMAFFFSSLFYSKSDLNSKSLRFGVGDQRGTFSSPFDVVWLSHGVVSTTFSFLGFHFCFLIEHPWKLIKNIYFWVFDFVCDRFWDFGDVVVMGLLLEWRKAPPLDPKLVSSPHSSQSSLLVL